jgi:hypothetical protein
LEARISRHGNVTDQYVTLTIVFFAETEMRKKLDREAFSDFVRAPAFA